MTRCPRPFLIVECLTWISCSATSIDRIIMTVNDLPLRGAPGRAGENTLRTYHIRARGKAQRKKELALEHLFNEFSANGEGDSVLALKSIYHEAPRHPSQVG